VDEDDLKPIKGKQPLKLRRDRIIDLIKYFRWLLAESADDILPLFHCMLSGVFSSRILRV